MCFKKPKLPEKTPEDKELEEELKAARIAQKKQIAAGLAHEKDAQTEAAYARALGFIGNRSLIAGPKGGAGFIGHGAGRIKARKATPTSPVAPPISLLPPSQSPNPIASIPSSGSPIHYSGGSWGGGAGGGEFARYSSLV